jgi:hypothetical protein
MVQGDPDCELIDNEVDWGRLIKIILLELEAQKPLPNIDSYWIKKGFDIKKRPMSLTLKMLHNFIDIDTEKQSQVYDDLCYADKDKEEDKDKDKSKRGHSQFLEFVYMTTEQHKALTDKYGSSIINQYIIKLNNYIGSRGRRYKSHYHTILSWLNKDNIQPKPKEVEKPKEELRFDPKVRELVSNTAKQLKEVK